VCVCVCVCVSVCVCVYVCVCACLCVCVEPIKTVCHVCVDGESGSHWVKKDAGICAWTHACVRACTCACMWPLTGGRHMGLNVKESFAPYTPQQQGMPVCASSCVLYMHTTMLPLGQLNKPDS